MASIGPPQIITRYNVSSSQSRTQIVYTNENEYGYFTIYHRVNWDAIRLIWIAFYKNNKNNKCKFDNLGKDTIMYILHFLLIATEDAKDMWI